MKTWQKVKDRRNPKGEEWRVGGKVFFYYPNAYAYRYIAHLTPSINHLYPKSRFFMSSFMIVVTSKIYWIEVTNRKDRVFNREAYFILLDEKKKIIKTLTNNEFLFLNGYQEIDKLKELFPYKEEYLPITQREIQ